MKTKILILLLLLSMGASAQWSSINSYGTKYKRLRSDSALAIPADTFFITMSDRNLPHIAAKDTVLYLWSITMQKWNAVGIIGVSGGSGGGGGLNYSFSAPFVVTGSQVSLPAVPSSIITGTKEASFITGTKDASFITGTKPFSFIQDFDYSVRRQLSGGSGIAYDTTTGVISLGSSEIETLEFSDGLEHLVTTGVVRAKYFTPMWNANRIQGYPVSAAQPLNGQTMVFNDTTGQLDWRPAGSVVSQAGATQNHYGYEFTGTSTGLFTLPKTPITGSVEVFVNGVKILSSCTTITVNTVLVNQSCIGYPIATTDKIDIKISSTQ